MVREELIKRSPLRILEKSIHGGVGKGNIAVIAAPKGTGKTACLVHIATDQLFQGKHVLHVSFSNETGHIVAWYEDIFKEICSRNKLDNAMDIHDEVVKNRIIMNFRQDGIHIPHIEKSLLQLMENVHFSADVIVIDGYDFSKSSVEEIAEFRAFAKKLNIEIWISATLSGPIAPTAVPEILKPFMGDISILIDLRPKGSVIHLELIKDHDATPVTNLKLDLDPKILLIAEER